MIGIGQAVLHYQILEKLGEGGMGVVYKAHDTKLERDVAIKFLPRQIAASEEERQRFKVEARAAAALNHPNIATIYAIEEHDDETRQQPGTLFIVMEYIEGRELKEAVGSGQLAVDTAIEIATQIASGLQAAHAKGIVHRDIKSSNIMVTESGQVKIMDFGLAKIRGGAQFTKVGTTLGTAAYMSPEQTRGEDTDHRTDIWAFGVVLYEMLTGELPFRGDYEQAVMYAILNEEPGPLQKHLPEAPSTLVHLMNRLLEKDREDRYQSMADVLSELHRLQKHASGVSSKSAQVEPAKAATDAIQTETGERTTDVRPSPWGAARKAGVGLGVVVLLAVAVWWMLSQLTSSDSFEPVQLSFTQLTSRPGMESFPDISPDGNFLVYTADAGGNTDVFLQRIGGGKAINLTEGVMEDDLQPAFSPDGQLIAFRSEREGGGIFIMGATGESVRRISDSGYHPAWSPDGSEVLFATESILLPTSRLSASELWSVDVTSREKRRIHAGDAVQPDYSPNGHRIAFWSLPEGGGQRDIFTIPANGGEPVAVTNDPHVDWSPRWSPDGKYLYFCSDRSGRMNLWRTRIDEESGEALGQPQPMTTPSSAVGNIAISRDGRRIVYESAQIRTQMQKLGFDPAKRAIVGTPRSIRPGNRPWLQPHPSPEEQWIAFQTSEPQEDIYIIRKDGSDLRQLTDDPYNDRRPVWSPDGERIAFYSNRSGKYEVWSIRPDGSGLEEITITPTGSTIFTPAWFPDGKRMTCISDSGTHFIDLTKPLGNRLSPALPFLTDEGDRFLAHAISSDGLWLAGVARQAGGGVLPGVIVYSMQENTFQKLNVSGQFLGQFSGDWLSDNRRLLFSDDNGFFIIDRISKQQQKLIELSSNIRVIWPRFSRDNRTIYFTTLEMDVDLWLAEIKEPDQN